jgi:rhamnose utilization protein RhaD (predicted bifunctional aldolase and dehydrogenase)/NAD(P)-dependent dehydrogenase (short-subunit alcohol dehydrogenase family)
MVENKWVSSAADGDLLDQRVATSRLLGSDPSLVLHGGGNTSVKIDEPDITGRMKKRIYIKGSGWDLSSIERQGFTGLDLERVLELSTLDALDDLSMARELSSMRVDPSSPAPSVESILHALIPFTFVDHTHADAVVTLTNTVHGIDYVKEVFGEDVIVLPYVMPGFDLASLAARTFPELVSPKTIGLVLMNHGIFTFGSTAKESYDRMIELVARAEQAIPQLPENLPEEKVNTGESSAKRVDLAKIRHTVSSYANKPMILTSSLNSQEVAFARDPHVSQLSQHGPATPDHVIWTKRVPLVGRDVEKFTEEYKSYFESGSTQSRNPVTMLDPAPRVVLDPELGMLTAETTIDRAIAVGDIYRHTIDIIRKAELLGGYSSLSAEDIFNVEYWDLEQAKVRRAQNAKAFAGRVVLITGAAGGIGFATAQHFLSEGAAVIGLDIEPTVSEAFTGESWLGIVCDLTDSDAVDHALDVAVKKYGGIDMVVLNAGVFPSTKMLVDLSTEEWRTVMSVNLDASVALLGKVHPLLQLAVGGGQVVIIGSKNVSAPGPGAVAYSSSKAALTQVARVLALEWATDNIRVNIIHPDAVFDTGIWTPELLKKRAEHYGLTVDQYKRRNLLGVEITSADVAQLVVAIAGPAFSKTTGAQVSIDGGNDRVI